MSQIQTREAIANVTRFFSEHPEKGYITDKSAIATLIDGLRCKAYCPPVTSTVRLS